MLSDKINSLPISQTVAMTAKAHDLKNQGIDVITLSAGEPDFDIPDYIKDAAVDAINKNYQPCYKLHVHHLLYPLLFCLT